MRKLDQLKSGSIKVLLSEIVVNEVQKHITNNAEDTQRKLKTSITKQVQRWSLSVDMAALSNDLALNDDPATAAYQQVQNYLSTIGGSIVSASADVDISQELPRRYFAVEPPFEAKKKNEFPDGFALLSLEALAKQHRKMILCVSPDEDWQNFAIQPEHLVCVEDINTALSYFNDSGRNTADKVVDMWRSGAATDLIEEVERAFEYLLDDRDFYADRQSPLLFKSEPISAVMQSVYIEGADNPIVIDADEEAITFTIYVEALVTFEANFSFFAQGLIDKGYFGLGSEDFSVEKCIEFQLVISVCRDITLQPKVLEIEVARILIEVDLGHVEPFQENPTHKKY